jgi:predicted alpha/beta hydrolase family esterase
VQQADWVWPRRGDWLARLDECLLADDRPAVLVAHSLGCQLVAAWAAHSAAHRTRVKPPCWSRRRTPSVPTCRRSWPAGAQIVRQRLPFPALVVYSEDDPFCAPHRAREMAAAWGARAHSLGARGHINADSGLGDWPDGLAG